VRRNSAGAPPQRGSTRFARRLKPILTRPLPESSFNANFGDLRGG
jgi:hypothetical protein